MRGGAAAAGHASKTIKVKTANRQDTFFNIITPLPVVRIVRNSSQFAPVPVTD
jgi:hypothetical protein